MSFSFGAKPAFGASTSFGAPQANLTFGSTPTTQAAQPQPSLFSTPTAQPGGGLTFGTPAASAAPPTNLFGANTTFGTPQTNLSFGAPAATPAPLFGTATTTPSTGFSFGSNPAPNLSFGAQPAAAKPGLSFGTPATTAATGLTFGAPATTSTGFSLGGTSTPGLNLGFGGTTSTAGTGLSFGTPVAQSSAFSLGTTTTPGTGLFAGFSTPGTTLTPAATSAAPAPAPTGLGGIASTTPTSTALATKTEQAPKEQNLPNEIQQTVDSFKNFVKQQKAYSSDVARCSIKEFRKVESDIDSVNSLLNELEKQLATNKNIAEKLKYDTARGLQQVEMAQRTYDTPLGLQYENTAPLMFFLELADSFERELQNMKLQIENTDKYVRNIGKPAPLSSQDLSVGMRRIHETFVALAGRLQSVHTQVEVQKEQYLNFRKHMLNDSTNVFESESKESDIINLALNSIHFEPPKIATGPTPFNSVSHPSVVQAAAQNTPPPAYGGNNTFGGFSTGIGGTSSVFGNTTFGQPFGGAANQTGFQLQKPPTGNKRGKP